MTDKPGAEVVRPATARPRGQPATAAEQEPPTEHEKAAIEHGLIELPKFSGGEVGDEADLGATVAVLRGRGPGYNFAGGTRWTAQETATRLAALSAAMHAVGEWPALLVADGISQPSDLAKHLTDSGWVEIERERIMWTRSAPGVPHLDPSLRIEAVTSRSAADYEAIERQIFDLPADFATQRTAGLSYSISAGWMRGYLVRLNGEAVATARLTAGDGVAGIFGVGVIAKERRRGLGSLVTAVATRAGLASGNKLVWLSVNELNDPAVRVYRQLGFQAGFEWSRWVATAGV